MNLPGECYMKNNKRKCKNKDCFKPSGLINWIGCDCCSSCYLNSCVNHSLSHSNNVKCFQCPLYVDVKSVNEASKSKDLVPDSYVKTAISNVRVLKRKPKDLRVSSQTVSEN